MVNVELFFIISRSNIQCLDYSRELKAAKQLAGALTKYRAQGAEQGEGALQLPWPCWGPQHKQRAEAPLQQPLPHPRGWDEQH